MSTLQQRRPQLSSPACTVRIQKRTPRVEPFTFPASGFWRDFWSGSCQNTPRKVRGSLLTYFNTTQEGGIARPPLPQVKLLHDKPNPCFKDTVSSHCNRLWGVTPVYGWETSAWCVFVKTWIWTPQRGVFLKFTMNNRKQHTPMLH